MWWPEFGRIQRPWNPWRELLQLQRDLTQIPEAAVSFARDFPSINIWVSPEDAIVTAEVAGVDPKDIDISITGETLTVTGSRKPEEMKEGETYHRRERPNGKFSRTVKLPYAIESTKVDAKYEKGSLKITLPRAESDKPRKIKIKSE